MRFDKKIKRRYYALFGILGLIGLAACSDNVEIDDNTQPAEPKEEYYITLNVTTNEQSSTRATTDPNGGSSSGDVTGTDKENALVSAHVYFCVDNRVVAEFESDYVQKVNNLQSSIRIQVNERIEDLEGLVGKTCQIFVVGNTKIENNQQLFNPIIGGVSSDDLSEATFSVNSVAGLPIGDFGESGHLMPFVNAREFKVTIPEADIFEDPINIIKALFEKDTATIHWWEVKDDAGVSKLDLERAVARLEYKDKRPEESETIDILKTPHNFRVGKMNVFARLYSLTPFNINKDSYLFRHAAEGSLEKATGIPFMLGNENNNEDPIANDSYNWIVNPDWSHSGEEYFFTNDPRNFLNPLSLNSKGDAFIIDNGGSTNDGTITVTELDKRSYGVEDTYHPWCYITENTVYSTALMESIDENKDLLAAKYSTGVLFTFKLLDKNNNLLTVNTPKEDMPLEMRRNGNNVMIIEPVSGDWVELPLQSDGNYHLKYIACIVHNGKKLNNDVMAPMFYGVVRNNTYQITIRELTHLPLPQDPLTMYLNADINVLNWKKKDVGYDF